MVYEQWPATASPHVTVEEALLRQPRQKHTTATTTYSDIFEINAFLFPKKKMQLRPETGLFDEITFNGIVNDFQVEHHQQTK